MLKSIYLNRLKNYKAGQEGAQKRRHGVFQASSQALDNAAVQELIQQSLETDDDSEDDLHWDIEETSSGPEEGRMQGAEEEEGTTSLSLTSAKGLKQIKSAPKYACRSQDLNPVR